MKLRYKILTGVGVFFALGITALAITVSYDSPCPEVPALAADATTMRAVMNRCYGVPQGLRVENIAKPTPGDGQVLIKVHASSVNPAEWYGVSGQPLMIRLFNGVGAPSHARVGLDVAGTVEAVGPNVTRFKPGDEVFGGVGGALAEYVVAREHGAIVMKPSNMTFEEAAGIPIAAITALQGLRDQGRIGPGQKVLINGASGGVGSYAVQIAKSFGAEVGVNAHAGTVGIVADTVAGSRFTQSISADAASVCTQVAGFYGHHQTKVIAPPFTHLLGIIQAARVKTTTCQTDGDTMTILVDYDAVVQIAVPVGISQIPQIHLHPGIAAICRCREIGIVGSAAILRFGVHRVAGGATAAVIVFLEVTTGFIEAVMIEHIMNQVVPVEEIGNGGRFIIIRVLV
jgi:D-arabinose 1-dehydrogenase-like Zn-dependent alcohol dehydrogenase